MAGVRGQMEAGDWLCDLTLPQTVGSPFLLPVSRRCYSAYWLLDCVGTKWIILNWTEPSCLPTDRPHGLDLRVPWGQRSWEDVSLQVPGTERPLFFYLQKPPGNYFLRRLSTLLHTFIFCTGNSTEVRLLRWVTQSLKGRSWKSFLVAFQFQSISWLFLSLSYSDLSFYNNNVWSLTNKMAMWILVCLIPSIWSILNVLSSVVLPAFAIIFF